MYSGSNTCTILEPSNNDWLRGVDNGYSTILSHTHIGLSTTYMTIRLTRLSDQIISRAI